MKGTRLLSGRVVKVSTSQDIELKVAHTNLYFCLYKIKVSHIKCTYTVNYTYV